MLQRLSCQLLRIALVIAATSTLMSLCPTASAAEPGPTAFYVGGNYAGPPGQEVMRGAMYVEHIRPPVRTRKYPLVMFHGSAQTAMNWIATPDGRKGWADYFAAQGYDVYLVDQPARGRSAWHPGLDGALRNLPVSTVEILFTASEKFGKWPQARLHTQWPGDGPNAGRKGDPVFDQFYASQVEYLASNAETQTMVRDAGLALLEKIGPSILLTHSQAGPFGWLLADARPDLVKGILAVEPNGPPIEAADGRKQLAWGVTDIPLTYAPGIKSAEDLSLVKDEAPEAAGLLPCWRQQQPARQLAKLKGIPTLILTTEASYHAQYDHCVSSWLTAAGVANSWIRLQDLRIYGNGHMVMLEKNSTAVAEAIHRWTIENVH